MIEDIRNFLPLNKNLFSSGMPTEEQMKSIAEAGVKVVINLAPFDSERDLKNEGTLVESLGMKYINIPVEWESPTRQNLEAFMKAMDENKNDKMLVHCRANFRAIGFIMLYHVHVLDGNGKKRSRFCAAFGIRMSIRSGKNLSRTIYRNHETNRICAS